MALPALALDLVLGRVGCKVLLENTALLELYPDPVYKSAPGDVKYG